MNEITLEWFFQIPGLFITIGVLLILIALLVLIIGGSKAKNKKQDDLALVDDVQEADVNQVESVNVLEPNSVDYLNGANNLNNSLENNGLANNLNNIGSVAPVMVNDTVAPTVNNSSNIITPVTIDESVIVPVDNLANTESIEKVSEDINVTLPQVEPVVPVMAQPIGVGNMASNETLTIQEPVLPAAAVNLNASSNTTQLVNNNEDANKHVNQEGTMSPIFKEPITPHENVTVPQVQEEVQKNDDIIVRESSSNVMVDNNNNNNNPTIIEPITPIVSPITPDFIEPIEPIKQQSTAVDNVVEVPSFVPNVNDAVNPTSSVENSEVEEIL